MNLADGFRWLVGRERTVQVETRELQRAEFAGIAEQLARIRRRRTAASGNPMAVPAIFRALSLIANTVGVLSLEAYQAGEKLPPERTPRIVIRPDPFNTPRVFLRDTSFNIARWGETWLWVAKRDFDGEALSVLSVDPREVQVTDNARDPRFPVIEWRNRRMPNEDMRQITYLRDPSNPLRGIGPLQACGAAVSVATASQDFAANYFDSTGIPPVWIKSAVDITDKEAEELLAKWMDKAPNEPRVTGPSIDSITPFTISAETSQLTESRTFQNGEVAVMFGIPGTLLEHAMQGASITYQNVGQEFDKFVRSCLWPNYLEPIEQTMSDLLRRQTVARFNVDGLLRADIKTRFDVYGVGIDKGIFGPEYAAQQEGILPGDVENRPVPFAVPTAIPSAVEMRSLPALRDVRCADCGRLNGRAAGAYEIVCKKCGRMLTAA